MSLGLKEQGWRWVLRPNDVFSRPWNWKPVSQIEANILAPSAPVVVVSRNGICERAWWYDRQKTFSCGASAYDRHTQRYYRYVGKGLSADEWKPVGRRTKSEAPAELEPELPAKTSPNKTWIGIELVNAEGSPLGKQRYLLELPDGTIIDGVLNANGQAFVDNIKPGSCKISFPNLDANDWQLV
jgi:hypothetical protein